ncbi:hypothetical protein [Rhodobacter lacus]|uniref:Uncharacterized protein n=1 Tax=Rhodobacter lacus TaxID=1641972 RepID=A0ABW5ADF2_9RHOB
MTPTQRSIKLLKEDGWEVAIVEKWNPHIRIRQDLFGFADLLAIKPGVTPLLVQTTSGSGTAARRTKILAEPRAETALQSGFEIVVHGWRKLKTKGNRWCAKVEPVTLEDFANVGATRALTGATG